MTWEVVDMETLSTVTRNNQSITGNDQSITGNDQSVTGNNQSVTGNNQSVTGNNQSVTGNDQTMLQPEQVKTEQSSDTELGMLTICMYLINLWVTSVRESLPILRLCEKTHAQSKSHTHKISDRCSQQS